MKKIFIIGVIFFVLIVLAAIFFVLQSVLSPPVLSTPISIGITNNSAPEFSFISNKAGTISYSGSCSSSSTSAVKGTNLVIFNSLSDGNYSNCQVKITSSEGKQSPPLDVPDFTVDTTKPVTTTNSNGYVNGNFAKSVTINLTCNDSGSGCNGNPYYTINGGSVQQGNSVTFNTEGIYALEYWSMDNAGNKEIPNTEFNNIKIDLGVTPSPWISIVSGTYENQSFNLTYVPTNSNDNCSYSVDGGSPLAYGACSGIFSNVTLSGEFSHIIVVYENDSVGNTGVSSPVTIIWETTPPSITLITFPESGGSYNQGSWQNISFSYGNAVTCQYSIDDNTWTNFNSCSDTSNYIPISSPSQQTLYLRGVDSAGNTGGGVPVLFTYQVTD